MSDTQVHDDKVEQAIVSRIHAHEAAKQAAERQLNAAREAVARAERAVSNWRFALEDYRTACGLPAKSDVVSPILANEYSAMGPTELVEYWAEKHDGLVVIKDLAKEGVKAGIFPTYRHGSSAVYAVVKRKAYDKVAPGCFRRRDQAIGHPNGHKEGPVGTRASQSLTMQPDHPDLVQTDIFN